LDTELQKPTRSTSWPAHMARRMKKGCNGIRITRSLQPNHLAPQPAADTSGFMLCAPAFLQVCQTDILFTEVCHFFVSILIFPGPVVKGKRRFCAKKPRRFLPSRLFALHMELLSRFEL